MKIGVCTSLDNLELLERLGYDFIEPSVSAVVSMTDKEFEQAEKALAKSRIRCEAFNMLFPGGVKLIGRQHDMDAVRSYIRKALPRVSKLGGRIVVFGSGGARSIPEGCEYDTAIRQLTDICRVLGDIAEPLDITVVMEPLNSKDCNLVNTVKQGLELVQKVDHPRFKLLADLYHMRLENETMDILAKAGSLLQHCHIACGAERAFPVQSNATESGGFLETLKTIGYENRLSVEGITGDFAADAAESYQYLRRVLEP